MKKTTGDIIILHMCLKNYDQMMYGSGDMACDEQTDRLMDFKFIYLISSTFQSILCVQDKTLKVLLKVIKESCGSLHRISFWSR